MPSSSSVVLRAAEAGDAQFIWEVNNEPSVRAQSLSTATIAWDDHVRWYERRLRSDTALTWVLEEDGTPAAVVRFDVDRTVDEATISVAVDVRRRGRGLGTRAIALGTEQLTALWPAQRVVAWVRKTNAESLRAFGRAGYVVVGTESRDGIDLVRLEFPRTEGI